jgi:hypothetical protein
MPIIPALERGRQKDCDFQASLGYPVRPSQNKKKELKIIFI